MQDICIKTTLIFCTWSYDLWTFSKSPHGLESISFKMDNVQFDWRHLRNASLERKQSWSGFFFFSLSFFPLKSIGLIIYRANTYLVKKHRFLKLSTLIKSHVAGREWIVYTSSSIRVDIFSYLCLFSSLIHQPSGQRPECWMLKPLTKAVMDD